jgi:Putative phage holin Dp-1
LITGKLYDVLKFLALVLFPALGTAYFALAGIWGLPSAQEVVGTIVVVDTLLGTVLQISSTQYNKSDAKFDGVIGVTETNEKLSYVLNLNEDPVKLKDKDEVRLKVGDSVAGTLAANT